MGNVGPMEILLLALLAVIVFGPKKLPEIGRSVGKTLREFKDSVGGHVDVREAVSGVQEVRAAMTPGNLAGHFVPGVKDVQESVAAAKSVVSNPLASAAEPAAPAAPAPAATPAPAAAPAPAPAPVEPAP